MLEIFKVDDSVLIPVKFQNDVFNFLWENLRLNSLDKHFDRLRVEAHFIVVVIPCHFEELCIWNIALGEVSLQIF